MIIIQDTREGLPYKFERWNIEIKTSGLKVGDYSIQGFEDKISIERKSLNDLIGCLTGSNRSRFERELSRARSFELFVVIIEADLLTITSGQYHSVMNPDAVLQSIVAFHIRYGTPFLFAGDRCGAEYLTYSLLQKFLYEIKKRFKQSQQFNLDGKGSVYASAG